MKHFKYLICVMLAAMVGACNDPVDEITEDGVGQAAALPVRTIGNGTEITIQTNTTFDSDTIYLLDGFVKFKNATLTIQPGTIVKGTDGSNGNPGTLVIERTAILDAAGTAQDPIIFTSNKPAGQRAAGDWGGILWLGNAFSNVKAGVNGAPINFLGNIEGVPPGVSPIRYGSGVGTINTNATENRGTLTYARIEFAGSILSEGDETNSLTLGGVGNGTTIHHVQVSFSSDDGFEWFGGTVDQKYLLAYKTADDDFDTDQGYLGRTQYAICQRDPDIFGTGSGGSRGFEANGDDGDAQNLIFFADPLFSHVTNVGPNGPINPNCTRTYAANEYNDGVVVRDKSKIDIFNSVITGYPRHAIFYEFPNDYFNRLTETQGSLLVVPNVVGASVSNLAPLPASITNRQNQVASALGCGALNATNVAARSGLKNDAWNIAAPDFTLPAGSPLLADTVYQHPRYNTNNLLGPPPFVIPRAYSFQDPSFLERPAFRGAMGTTDGNWQISLWVEYDPQSQPYL